MGKTTLVNHAITQAQKMGLLPVIIDTENAFSVEFAQSMGFEAEPIYGMVEMEEMDIETGEIFITEREEIVGYDGNLMYFNSRLLADRYGDIDWSKGVRTKAKRKIAVIEDVAALINDILDAQDRGEIQQGILFVWDSVGSIGCYKELSSGGDIGKNGNPMWTAAAISAAVSSVINSFLETITSPVSGSITSLAAKRPITRSATVTTALPVSSIISSTSIPFSVPQSSVEIITS